MLQRWTIAFVRCSMSHVREECNLEAQLMVRVMLSYFSSERSPGLSDSLDGLGVLHTFRHFTPMLSVPINLATWHALSCTGMGRYYMFSRPSIGYNHSGICDSWSG